MFLADGRIPFNSERIQSPKSKWFDLASVDRTHNSHHTNDRHSTSQLEPHGPLCRFHAGGRED